MSKNDPKLYFPIIHCMEESIDVVDGAKDCVHENSKLDFETVHACAYGKMGEELLHKNGLETDALNPPKRGVPWVTINGKGSMKIEAEVQNNLLAVICKNYKGSKPKFCKKSLFQMALSKLQEAMYYANAY